MSKRFDGREDKPSQVCRHQHTSKQQTLSVFHSFCNYQNNLRCKRRRGCCHGRHVRSSNCKLGGNPRKDVSVGVTLLGILSRSSLVSNERFSSISPSTDSLTVRLASCLIFAVLPSLAVASPLPHMLIPHNPIDRCLLAMFAIDAVRKVRRHAHPISPLLSFFFLSQGHWIKDCPTNSDHNFDNRPRIKRTTGIPRSMLKAVENPTSEQLGQGVMVTPEGGYVVAQPDS